MHANEVGRTPVHHEFLRGHSRRHSLVLLNLFLSILVGIVFLDESVGGRELLDHQGWEYVYQS